MDYDTANKKLVELAEQRDRGDKKVVAIKEVKLNGVYAYVYEMLKVTVEVAKGDKFNLAEFNKMVFSSGLMYGSMRVTDTAIKELFKLVKGDIT